MTMNGERNTVAFSEVIKDAQGFDDIDAFWFAADQLDSSTQGAARSTNNIPRLADVFTSSAAVATTATSTTAVAVADALGDGELREYCDSHGLTWLHLPSTAAAEGAVIQLEDAAEFDYDTSSSITDFDPVDAESDSDVELDSSHNASQFAETNHSNSNSINNSSSKVLLDASVISRRASAASVSGYLAGASSRSLLSITGLSELNEQRHNSNSSNNNSNNSSSSVVTTSLLSQSNYTGRSSSVSETHSRDTSLRSSIGTTDNSTNYDDSNNNSSSNSLSRTSSAVTKRSEAQLASPSLLNSTADSIGNNKTEWSTVDELNLTVDRSSTSSRGNNTSTVAAATVAGFNSSAISARDIGNSSAVANRSSRRVSFGENIELSPITAAASPAKSSSSSSTPTIESNNNNSSNSISKNNSNSKNNSSSRISKTPGSSGRKSTSASKQQQQSQLSSSVRSSSSLGRSSRTSVNYNDDNSDDNSGGGGDVGDDSFDLPDDLPDDEVLQEPTDDFSDEFRDDDDAVAASRNSNSSSKKSRISDGNSTFATPKSALKSVSSVKSSDRSSRDNSNNSSSSNSNSINRNSSSSKRDRSSNNSTPGSSGSRRHSSSSLLATPASNEFPRGVQHLDETYEEIATDIEDDAEDADTATKASSSSNSKRRKTTAAAAGDLDESLAAEEESSFMDNSFVNTINSANQKYQQGKKALTKLHRGNAAVVGTATGAALVAVTKAKKSSSLVSKKLYDSDDDADDVDATAAAGAGSASEEEESDDEEDGVEGLRRSRRATKGRRFAFWKSERPIYEQGTMVGLLTAEPTPRKQKKRQQQQQLQSQDGDELNQQKMKRRRGVSSNSNNSGGEYGNDFYDQAAVELPPVQLPRDVNYVAVNDGFLAVWDDMAGSESDMKVVTTFDSLQPASALPRTARRPPGRDKVGNAAHCFNVPEVPGIISGWISGYVALPPEAIKDAEGVGKYSQVFFVSDCQDGALELGIAHPQLDVWNQHTAQRLLLKKGDSFFIPPGNIYRLENHSSVKECMLFWTIIKPIEEDAEAVAATAVSTTAATASPSAAAADTESDRALARSAAIAAANAAVNASMSSSGAVKRAAKKKKKSTAVVSNTSQQMEEDM